MKNKKKDINKFIAEEMEKSYKVVQAFLGKIKGQEYQRGFDEGKQEGLNWNRPEILAAKIKQAKVEERDRWINQPANHHDERIRKQAKLETIGEIKAYCLDHYWDTLEYERPTIELHIKAIFKKLKQTVMEEEGK